MDFIVLIILATTLTKTVSSNCTEETDLNDLSSRLTSKFWGDGAIINDYHLSEKWYRTMYDGWQYLMADGTNVTEYTQCGTYWPIYLKEKHPAVTNITEEPITVTACVLDHLFPCDVKYEVKIRQCNRTIQYFLRQTKSYAGYCFDKHQALDAKTPAPTNVNLGTIFVSPELVFLEDGPISKPLILFRCNFLQQNGLFYTVTWYVDQEKLVVLKPTQNINDTIVNETYLYSRNVTLGANFRCGVSVSADEEGQKTEEKISRSYYAGVIVLKPTLLITKGDIATIQMRTTIPIGCDYSRTGRARDFNFCENSDYIYMFQENDGNCSSKITGVANHLVSNAQCTTGFPTLQKGDRWDPSKIYEFKIATTDINYDDKTEFTLKLRFHENIPHRILRKFEFPEIRVHVVDNRDYQGKVCEAYLDPHMKTADGHYYEHHKEGYYMLYENFKYDIEIQEATAVCTYRWVENGTCVCGITIRAGRDVFMMNFCGNISYLDFIQCEDGGILQVNKINDWKYEVFTPIGTKITISVLTWLAIHNTLNVQITMAPKDMGNVRGLCGYFDGNMTNDLRHSDNVTVSEINQQSPNPFTDSWSLDNPSLQSKNLFRSHQRELNSWQERNGVYCACRRNTLTRETEAVCSASQYLDCTFPNSITKNKCRVIGTRRKRSVLGHDKELARLYKLMEPADAFTHKRRLLSKRDDTIGMITAEEAIAICSRNINGSLVIQSYNDINPVHNIDELVRACAFDVRVANNISLAGAHVDSLNDGAKNMLEREPSYVEKNPEKVETFLLNTCPNNCSGKGTCTKSSECNCQVHFHGPDCSIDDRNALTIDDIEGGGLCDTSEDGECTCFKVRSNNILRGMKCSVATSKIFEDGKELNVSLKDFPGGYEDIFTAECCIPENIVGMSGVFVAKYGVSISNIGNVYSNTKNVYVFDSTCQAEPGNDSKLFTMKTGYCFIDGSCASDGDMAGSGCFACISNSSQFNWTVYNPCKNEGQCYGREDGYECTCQPGYSGSDCEIDIDECTSNPCNNGATCTDRINGYNCICGPGYTDNDCETDIDECASDPCNNGATCTDIINGYNCTCAPGYSGEHCEIDIDECASDPCYNDATCTDIINGYNCTCAPGYSGEHCEIDIDECTYNPCNNGATCTDRINGYSCICGPGYTGKDCETDIDDCASDPCSNGATCTDMISGYDCTCSPGYAGEHCEIDKDECASSPCNNGATCTDKINGYTCICASGYTGKRCEAELDECISRPCNNGATCTDRFNGYSCTCAPGYTGKNCKTDINECASGPCNNGATCTDRINGYSCTCAAGYTGEHCQTVTYECGSSPCNTSARCTNRQSGESCACTADYRGLLSDPGCGELVTSSGFIRSKNYPGNYEDFLDCRYEINVEIGKRVELEFTYFQIEDHYYCGYDYVQVLDVWCDGTENQLYKGCGYTLPRTTTYSQQCGKLVILFHTDYSVVFKGFELKYKTV